MDITVKHFSQLNIYELHEIYKARVNVFVVEQNCPYAELDGFDTSSYHLWVCDKGSIVSYLRVLPPGTKYAEASIGRVLSLKRRQGYARELILAGIRTAREKFSANAIRIEAQTYVSELYSSVGFRQVSDEFLEDGIPHIEMLWEAVEDGTT